MGRLALFAAVGAGALALSGCHEVLRAASAPTSRSTSSRTDGASPSIADDRCRAPLYRPRRRRAVQLQAAAREHQDKDERPSFIGDYKSDLAGSPLASGKWHARFKVLRNRATGKTVITGLVLATFDDTTAGRACLNLSQEHVRKNNRRRLKRSRGKVTVVGGEGGARTLYGTARARVHLKRDGSAPQRPDEVTAREWSAASRARARGSSGSSASLRCPISFRRAGSLNCIGPARIDTRTVALDPGRTLAYEEDEWHDALVTVESGELELEMLCGRSAFFQKGDVLWLQGLPLASLRNRGAEPLVLVAASRNREIP